MSNGKDWMAARRHLCKMLTYKEDGLEYTCTELAIKLGVRPDTLRGRLKRAGNPTEVSWALAVGNLEKQSGTVAERVKYGKHGWVTFAQIKQLQKGRGRSLQYYKSRWAAFGRPSEVCYDMFNLTADEVWELTGIKVATALQEVKGVKPANPRYLDKHFLPEIPFGDLAYLSGEKNTGAAREGCDDEIKSFCRGHEAPYFSGYMSGGTPVYTGRQ